MNISDDQLDRLIADLAPEPELSGAVLVRNRRELLGLIDQVHDLTAAPANLKPRRWTRRMAYAGAVAAAMAIGVLGVQTLAGPGGASAAATEVLTSSANQSIQTVDPVVVAGEFTRIAKTSRWRAYAFDGGVSNGFHPGEVPVTAEWLESNRTVEWIPADHDEAWFTLSEPVKLERVIHGSAESFFPGGTEIRSAPGGWMAEYPPGWQTPTTEWLAELPRDTEELRDLLYTDSAGKGNSSDGEVLVYIGDCLRSGIVPADLRAALFRVMATIPGVTVTAEQVTLDGRSGVAIGRLETVDGQRTELIIDPERGTVIGERTITVDEAGESVVTASTAIETDVVDKVPQDVRRQAS